MKDKRFWRQIIVYTVYVLAFSLLQGTWPESLSVRGQKPDLTLILAVLSGYLFGSADGFAIGLSAGLMRDLLAGRVLGLGMLILMYLGLIASFLLQRFFRRSLFFSMLQVAFFTAVYQFLIALITVLVPFTADAPPRLSDLLYHLLWPLPGQVLVNLIAGILMAFLLIWLGPYKRGGQDSEGKEIITRDSIWRIE